MLVGVWRGSGSPVRSTSVAAIPSREQQRYLRLAALALGLLGFAGFAYCVIEVGGLEAAYGQGYGGGWSDNGYVREMMLLTLPALLCLMVSYQRERPKWFIWILVLVIASPFLVQGLLGGRRGPIFMVLVGLGVGWYFMRQTRPRFVTLLAGGGLLGGVLLLLVTNRGEIYLGSEFQLESAPLDYLRAGTGNEYIYGGALILYSQDQDIYWGGRYIQSFLVRPIPRAWWPTKYDDASQMLGVPSVDGGNGGLATGDLRGSVGWIGAVGASPGIVTDVWVEFWWFGLAVLYGIGWAYGRAWRMGVTRGGVWIPCFGIMTALSIYLVMQTLEAMGFRALLMLAGVAVTWAVGKRGEHAAGIQHLVSSVGTSVTVIDSSPSPNQAAR
jgi:hypothetical protein